MNAITDWLRGLSGPVVYAVVAALVFAEDALFVGFVGFVVPGETSAILGGLLAHQGKVSLTWITVAVVGAAVLGDSVGYEIGRRFGPSLLHTRALRRHEERIDRAREFMSRRGSAAVFFGRFVAFVRTMVPALAGTSRMPYRRFLFYNAVGGIAWGVGCTLLGYFAGAAYGRIEGFAGRVAAIALAALVVVAVVVWHLRRRRARRRDQRS